jgi:glycosyltransferase involved in cell wall biosynthesis
MCTCHGEATKRPDLAAYLAIENLFLRKAAGVFAVSSSIREELIARKVAAWKISIVNNGITDPVNNGRDRRAASADRRSFPHLICIGRLIESKRFDLAIEAVHVLRGEYPNILLSIAGDGPCEGALRNRVRELDLESHVVLHGFVKDTGRIYEDGDIFLLPSETEGSPIVLIEAMAYGLPIVVAPAGAIPEMVKDGQSALFVEPNEAAGIIRAIRKIICDENCRTGLGRNARGVFLARFNAHTMAYAYATQYRAVFDEWGQPEEASRG